MSEIWSWDGTRDTEGTTYTIRPEYGSIPVRVVAWPEGAPKQEDVPQAGEARVWQGDEITIISGIPNIRHDHTWCLHCYNKKARQPCIWNVPVGDLKPIPQAPPQTYTEDEIRAAIANSQLVTPNFFTTGIIARLREDKP